MTFPILEIQHKHKSLKKKKIYFIYKLLITIQIKDAYA